MTVSEYVAHARKLLGDATKRSGEAWRYGTCTREGVDYTWIDRALSHHSITDTVAEGVTADDAAFIVASHNDLVPTLLGVVEAYHKRLAALVEMLTRDVALGNQLIDAKALLAQPIDAFREDDTDAL